MRRHNLHSAYLTGMADEAHLHDACPDRYPDDVAVGIEDAAAGHAVDDRHIERDDLFPRADFPGSFGSSRQWRAARMTPSQISIADRPMA